MSELSIWSPINQQYFWLPGVFYKGKELRLGALSYIYAFSRCFYPKWLTIAFRLYIFISINVYTLKGSLSLLPV